MKPAVFFDRDGVLNVDHAYVYKIEDWEWMPGALSAIRLANERGYAVVVVTNQSGIGRGFYSEANLAILHDYVRTSAREEGAQIDAFYFCPHMPGDDCDCRKPKPGMIEQAIREMDLDRERSILIGDKLSDIQAATAAGIMGILYKGGDLRRVLETAIEVS